jgi:hypothetical protein
MAAWVLAKGLIERIVGGDATNLKMKRMSKGVAKGALKADRLEVRILRNTVVIHAVGKGVLQAQLTLPFALHETDTLAISGIDVRIPLELT